MSPAQYSLALQVQNYGLKHLSFPFLSISETHTVKVCITAHHCGISMRASLSTTMSEINDRLFWPFTKTSRFLCMFSGDSLARRGVSQQKSRHAGRCYARNAHLYPLDNDRPYEEIERVLGLVCIRVVCGRPS